MAFGMEGKPFYKESSKKLTSLRHRLDFHCSDDNMWTSFWPRTSFLTSRLYIIEFSWLLFWDKFVSSTSQVLTNTRAESGHAQSPLVSLSCTFKLSFFVGVPIVFTCFVHVRKHFRLHTKLVFVCLDWYSSYHYHKRLNPKPQRQNRPNNSTNYHTPVTKNHLGPRWLCKSPKISENTFGRTRWDA